MKILLGVTGSVAATLTEKLVKALRAAGHEVQIVFTVPAWYFVGMGRMGLIGRIGRKITRWSRRQPMEVFGVPAWTDFEEWPGTRYRKNQEIPHIALRDWADAIVIAPLSANTLAKAANGICDNLLTCVLRAWDRKKPVVIAPAMNTKMWEHPATAEHIAKMKGWYDLRLVPPVERKLACGDTGVGAMADIAEIVKVI